MKRRDQRLDIRNWAHNSWGGREGRLQGEVQTSISQLHGERLQADNSGAVPSCFIFIAGYFYFTNDITCVSLGYDT